MATSTAKPKKRTSKGSQAAAAVAEVNETPDKGKSIDWHGHVFKLPERLPKALLFRLSQVREADGPQPMLGLMESLLNKVDETQYGVVIREIERADDEDAVIAEAYKLVSDIFNLYEVAEGESGASQDS